MANITLYKHGDLEIYLELFADDSLIGFAGTGCIRIDKEYRSIEDDYEFNMMATELEKLINELNDPSKSERELVQLYIDFIAEWDCHNNTYIIEEDEVNKYVDKDGHVRLGWEAFVSNINGFYVYDEV